MSDHTGVDGEGRGATHRLWGGEETIQRGWIIIHEPNRCVDLHIPTPQSEEGLDAALEALTKLRPAGTVLTVARLTWNGELWIEGGADRLAEKALYDSLTPEDWAQINGRHEDDSEGEEPAPCDEPRHGRDATAAPGHSPAGAVPAGQVSDPLADLKAENERLRELLADRTAERDAARRAHQQARATLAESERKWVEAVEALKPFALAAGHYEPDEGDGDHSLWADDGLRVRHLRAASSALIAQEVEHGR